MSVYLLSLLLISSWMAALATLLIFLESWFAVSRRNRLVARRASGAYGIVTVFFPMYGAAESIESSLRSILSQSYPFLEVFLIYSEDDPVHSSLAQEFRSRRSHAAVRLVPVSGSLRTVHDRIPALDLAQRSAKGRWQLLLHPEVTLDRFAVETALEFAGTGEISALALRPGLQCRSWLHRLLAPSIEYLLQMIRIVQLRKKRFRKMEVDAPFLLVNREAFEIVHRINKMPGILNEAGWSAWSYRVEGLRTFDGDGSGWVHRHVTAGSWAANAEDGRRYTGRSGQLVAANMAVSAVPVVGLAYGFIFPMETFLEVSVLAFSSVSYSLMAIGYYLHAHRLHTPLWFAPFWFLAHIPASLLMLFDIRRTLNASDARHSEAFDKAGKV